MSSQPEPREDPLEPRDEPLEPVLVEGASLPVEEPEDSLEEPLEVEEPPPLLIWEMMNLAPSSVSPLLRN